MTNSIRGIFNGDNFSGVGYGYVKQEKTEEPVQTAAPEITPDFINPEDVMEFMNNGVTAFVPQQPAIPTEFDPELVDRIQGFVHDFEITRATIVKEFGEKNTDIILNLMM